MPSPVTPRFSVILPTHCRPAYLWSAAESVLEQTFDDLELWIVDDGSGAETVEVCAGLKADRRVRVTRNDTALGAAAARNRGACRAGGEYLAFIDDDCVWHPARLETVDRAIREIRPRPGYVCTQTVVIHRGPPRTYERAPVLLPGDAPWHVGTHMITVDREVFLKEGGFDERLPRGHDWDLAVRLVKATRWHLVPVPLAWTDRPEGLSDDPAKMERGSRVLAAKYGRRSPLPRRLTADFHTAFAHKLLHAGHWREGVRHYGLAVNLAPGRARSWLYLAAALAGPAVYGLAVRITRRILRRPLHDRAAGKR